MIVISQKSYEMYQDRQKQRQADTKIDRDRDWNREKTFFFSKVRELLSELFNSICSLHFVHREWLSLNAATYPYSSLTLSSRRGWSCPIILPQMQRDWSKRKLSYQRLLWRHGIDLRFKMHVASSCQFPYAWKWNILFYGIFSLYIFKEVYLKASVGISKF